MKIDRRHYADHYGPTTGDRVRLADTDLLIRIERDFTVYGEEAIFGGGKVIRDGMGQSPVVTRAQGAPDLVITSVVVIDANGIYKADVGVRDGRISAIGKAGNADIMDGVTPGLEIGASTEILCPTMAITPAAANRTMRLLLRPSICFSLQFPTGDRYLRVRGSWPRAPASAMGSAGPDRRCPFAAPQPVTDCAGCNLSSTRSGSSASASVSLFRMRFMRSLSSAPSQRDTTSVATPFTTRTLLARESTRLPPRTTKSDRFARRRTKTLSGSARERSTTARARLPIAS